MKFELSWRHAVSRKNWSGYVPRDVAVQFAEDALEPLGKFAEKDDFAIDSSTSWNALNGEKLQHYQRAAWRNDSPKNPEQRLAFQKYMENGGAWLGFSLCSLQRQRHELVEVRRFPGGAVFYINSWPPSGGAVVDDPSHSVTANLPSHFVSPVNEWYAGKPSPRLNKDAARINGGGSP